MAKLEKTCQLLEDKSRIHGAVLVGFSAGKDSLAVLDLCKRYFARVVPFFLYQVPGLQVIEDRLKEAEDRWGVKVLQYPHWQLAGEMAGGVYCTTPRGSWRWNKITPKQLYDIIRADTGVSLIAAGEKRIDFPSRNAKIKTNADKNKVFPIGDWNNKDVYGYLKMRAIEPPEAHRDAGGIDLTAKSFLWMAEKYPDDFEKICRAFPFARAVVMRKQWYGIPA